MPVRGRHADKRELRVFPLECRSSKPRTFRGYAAVFNSLSAELWGFFERIAPGAFDRAVNGEDDVRFLIGHDPKLILARSTSGTLVLSQDSHGLFVEAELPDTSYARDLEVSLERGDISQMSFGFRVIEDSWDEEVVTNDAGQEVTITVRTLLAVETLDVSAVSFPAYAATEAEISGARSPVAVRSFVASPGGVKTGSRSLLRSEDVELELVRLRLRAMRLGYRARKLR
jgi:hypothetical protein